MPFIAQQKAEWNRARLALLCQPDLETSFGLLINDAVNFCYPFSLKEAVREHQIYRETLEGEGVKVFDLREAMLHKTLDEQGNIIQGENLTRLRKQALKCIEMDLIDINPLQKEEILKKLEHSIALQHPKDILNYLFLRPLLEVKKNQLALDKTSRYNVSFQVRPVTNQYFMRDSIITTAKGVVVANLRLKARKAETENITFALKQLGIKPLYQVKEPGFLEGGDFIPAGDFVLQGQGLLTNFNGIKQLMDHGVYGEVEVAVVKDPRLNMDEMHLDTYFNLLDRDLAVLCEDRIGTPFEPCVEVYQPHQEKGKIIYQLADTLPFTNYLKSKGINIIPVTKEEQQNYALNFLLIKPGWIIGVKKAGKKYKNKLREYGVDGYFLDFNALTGGYGGPHCMSQVLLRKDSTDK